MKNLILITVLITFFIIPTYSFSQGIFVTKSGDTIHFTKYTVKNTSFKYWVEGNKKPLKIKREDLEFKLSYPKYILEKDEKDEFTGNLNRVTEAIPVGKLKNEIYPLFAIKIHKVISQEVTEYYLMMYTILINQGCSGAVDNYAMIKLMNNEVIELNNDIAKVNCESGESSKSVYLLSKDIFNKLKVNKIKSIRFNQSKTYADYNILIPDVLIKKIELLDTK